MKRRRWAILLGILLIFSQWTAEATLEGVTRMRQAAQKFMEREQWEPAYWLLADLAEEYRLLLMADSDNGAERAAERGVVERIQSIAQRLFDGEQFELAALLLNELMEAYQALLAANEPAVPAPSLDGNAEIISLQRDLANARAELTETQVALLEAQTSAATLKEAWLAAQMELASAQAEVTLLQNALIAAKLETAPPKEEVSPLRAASSARSIEIGRMPASGQPMVATGWKHSLALDVQGTVWAWGNNDYGQIGDGSSADCGHPVAVMRDAVAIAAGEYHSLALKADGTLWAWGDNRYGQLGDGTTVQRTTAVQVPLTRVTQIAAHGYFSLARTADGILWAWGNNESGQLGQGNTDPSAQPVVVMNDVIALSAGYRHALALTNEGTVWAWGYNEDGRIDGHPSPLALSPIPVMTNGVSISAGNGHSLIGTADDVLWGLGKNEYGELGTTPEGHPVGPQKMATDARQFIGGGNSTLLLSEDLTLSGIGQNCFGQLGDGTTSGSMAPAVLNDVLTADIWFHAIAVKTDGSVWTWGWGGPQLGDDTTAHRATPVKIDLNLLNP